MAKLRIDRKAFFRKGYVRKEGTRVSPAKVPRSVFLIKDRGKPGRAEKVLPKLKHPGILGEGYFSKSDAERHRILAGMARKKGEMVVGGRMQWVSTMMKRTKPEISRKAAMDRAWVHANFAGKKRA